jgi:hypothetical protein
VLLRFTDDTFLSADEISSTYGSLSSVTGRQLTAYPKYRSRLQAQAAGPLQVWETVQAVHLGHRWTGAVRYLCWPLLAPLTAFQLPDTDIKLLSRRARCVLLYSDSWMALTQSLSVRRHTHVRYFEQRNVRCPCVSPAITTTVSSEC